MPIVPSLFPALFDWAFWVPFIFRIFLAAQLLWEAQRLYRGAHPILIRPDGTAPSQNARICIISLLALLGTLLAAGLATQAVGVVVACAMFLRYVQSTSESGPQNESLGQLLLLSSLVALSLVFLGPGPYSVDLPL